MALFGDRLHAPIKTLDKIMVRKTKSQPKTNNATPASKSAIAEPANTDSVPIQFDWKKHWNKKVKPHLEHPLVQFALDAGMSCVRRHWKSGDAPCRVADEGSKEAKSGTLALGINRLTNAIGYHSFLWLLALLIIPNCDGNWKEVRSHTVPIGYDQAGQAGVVMDILLFDTMPAEGSIGFAFAKSKSAKQDIFRYFESDFCRVAARKLSPAMLRLTIAGCSAQTCDESLSSQ